MYILSWVGISYMRAGQSALYKFRGFIPRANYTDRVTATFGEASSNFYW
jgi:hypothetical protein